MSRGFGIGNGLMYDFSGATSFDPTQINGNVLWLRADKGITLDGSNNVSQWNDQSGNGNNASQGNASLRPGYSSNGGPNATAYLNWTAINQWLNSAGLGTIAQPFEYFFVARSPGAPSLNAYLLDSIGAPNQAATFQNAGTMTLQENSGGSGPSVTLTANTDFIVDCVFNGASSSIALNNGAPAVGNAGANPINSGVTLGNIESAIGVRGWQGRIYEVAIYNQQISSTNRTKLTEYFGTRYGISVP